MPPKKDDKKGKAKGKAPPKEIDPLIYKRQPFVFEELEEISSKPISGYVINTDSLFPEWDISIEDWTVGPEAGADADSLLRYPEHIIPSDFKSLKAVLVREIEDPAVTQAAKGAKKEAPKKGAAPVVQDLEEPHMDSGGNLLPRM